MKKIGIYSSIYAGDVKDKEIDYIAVDQGLEHLQSLGITPLLVIGDQDSLENKDLLHDLKIKRYSPIKDETDTALALNYAIEKGYDCIDIYGVTQKRMDHFMAVLCLLRQYPELSITLYDEFNKIMVLTKGTHHIEKGDYKYFSLFSFTDTYVTLKNCHYPLDHYLLNPSDPLCVSNQCDEYVDITIDQDLLFIQAN